MDSIFLQRMREEKMWFLIMSMVYGGLFTLCLYRNMSGITFPVITAVSLWISVLFLKKAGITLQKGTLRYFAEIFLLGISTVLTDNGFFHFFNNVGIILLFMMAMAHQLYEDSEWGFSDYVKKFFSMLWIWIISVGEIFHRSGKKEKVPTTKRKNAGSVLWGILAAVLMLIIVLPLLMMSDEIFSSFFSFLNPFHLFLEVDFSNIIGIIFTFLVGMAALYAFFAGLFKMNLGGKDERKPGKSNYVTGITFTGIVAAVFTVCTSGILAAFICQPDQFCDSPYMCKNI